MHHYAQMQVDQTRILTRSELDALWAYLSHRAPWSEKYRLDRTIARLAASCGLRASEIAGLNVEDVVLETPWPHLLVRAVVAKNNRKRKVPLWWDQSVQQDIAQWREERQESVAKPNDPFVARCTGAYANRRLSRFTLRRRFRNVCQFLCGERASQLSIHSARHTFCSHALASGRSLVEVRDAAGHANIAMTSCYLHVLPEPF